MSENIDQSETKKTFPSLERLISMIHREIMRTAIIESQLSKLKKEALSTKSQYD